MTSGPEFRHLSRISVRRHCWLVQQCCLLALLLIAVLVNPASAQPTPDEPEFESIRMGFGNRYKVGCWTPVELSIRGGREPAQGIVTLTTPDGDGANSTVQSDRPIQLIPGQLTKVWLYVKPGRFDADYTARVLALPLETGDVLAQHIFDTRYEPDARHPGVALSATAELIVTIGNSLGVDESLRERNLNQHADFESVSVTLADVNELPARWYGYDGVDRLLVAGSRPELYSSLTAANPRLEAIRHWVRMGGSLVLSVGGQADQLIGPNAPFAEFVPGRYDGLIEIRPGRAFETYIAASDPLPALRSRGGEGRLSVPKILDPRGSVDVREGADVPLVIRAPFGFGDVTFVAAELDQAPFPRWSQLGRLVGRLLQFPEPVADANLAQQRMLGYNDLAGKLRAGLDQFTGVKVAPFSLVAALILGYLVLIGPVDYLLVKKIFKRMELTWITFPLMVLLVTAGAYLMAFQMKGRALLVNQVDVVDVDLTQADSAGVFTRGTSWMNVFSPRMRSYDVSTTPKLPGAASPASAEVLMSWMGLPGNGFGAMNQSAADPPLFARSYYFSPNLDQMLRVPVRVWSTKGFTARWSTIVPSDSPFVTAELQARFGDALEGKVTNDLPFALEDCLLAYRGASYRLRRIEPGSTAEFNELGQRRLQLELNERAGVTNSESMSPWEVSVDLTKLPEQMMFASVSGAGQAGKLANRYHDFLDLSDHLTMNQAILVGRASTPVAPLELNGESPQNENNKQYTFFRFLLPVKPRASGDSANP